MVSRRDFIRGLCAGPLIVAGAERSSMAKSEPVFPNGATCAVSFSIDDGFWVSSQKFMTLFAKYGMKGTFNLVTSWITPVKSEIGDSYNQNLTHGTWSDWKTVLDTGHEIGSHSMTHPHLPDIPLDEARRELIYSKRRITQRLGLPGSKTFAFPYNHTSPAIEELVEKYYLAGRIGGEGINLPGEIEFAHVSSWWPLSTMPTGMTLDKIREAKDKRAWLVIGLHGVDDEGWHPIPYERMDAILKFLADDGEICVDTFKALAVRLKKFA